MHTLLGYSWAELASILAVVSALFSGIYWLIKHSAKALNNAIKIGTYPLQQQFEKLTNTIEQLNNNFEEQHESLEKLENEVERHHDELIRHDKRIESLERDIK